MSAFRHIDTALFGPGDVVEFDLTMPSGVPGYAQMLVRCRGRILREAVDPPTRTNRWWTVETKRSPHDEKTIEVDIDEVLTNVTHSRVRLPKYP